ncbi:LysM peptidoglycan-binding domain-containing protein [Neptunicella sp. SCSIO 80796]|uniref:LysM peptidoglycan-binding domain-containing protein n=1 Tax=Neptunicella plasticusilytica TaxID=3117012 RepID=UPI003A4DF212
MIFPLCCAAVTIKDSAPEKYVVKKGDTLWDISSLYLQQPWQWPELWRNNTYIVNPHLIYPGDELYLIINQAGEPELELVREPEVTKPLVKLSPQGKRITKPVLPVPTIPWSVIEGFVSNDFIMSDEEYQTLPVILGDGDASIRFASGDLVLSDKITDTSGNYSIVRQQGEIIDMEGEVVGWHVRHVADAKLVPTDAGKGTLVNVEGSKFEAMRGDRVMQTPAISEDRALGLVPANNQQGHILTNLQQHKLMGKYDVVAIDLGSSDVVPGTVMGIYTQGPKIRASDEPTYEGESSWLKSVFLSSEDMEQPALKVGELVIFKVFDNSSYALITRSTKIIKRGAIVAHP